MSALLTQYEHQFLIFLLVLTRIAGLISVVGYASAYRTSDVGTSIC